MNRSHVVASLVALSFAALSAGAQSPPVGWTYTMNMIVDSGGVAHRSSTAMRYAIVPGKVRMQFLQVSNNPDGGQVEGMYQVINAVDSTVLMVMPSQQSAMVMGFSSVSGAKAAQTKFETHVVHSQVEDLGAGERISGHATRHMRLHDEGTLEVMLGGEHCSIPINSTSDVWIAPDVDITQALNTTLGVIGKLLGSDAIPASATRSDLPSGTMLRSIAQMMRPDATGKLHPMTMTMELHELAHGPVDPALFEAPAGVKVMDMREMMKGIPQSTLDSAAAKAASTNPSAKSACGALGGTP
jgi:hypothetical protein